MRSSLPASLISLLLHSIVVATASREACLHLKAEDLAEGAACGEKGQLRNCFANVLEPISINTLQNCFVGAGCTYDESVLEARWMLKYCDGNPDELKRRRPEGVLVRADSTTTADATTANAATTDATTTDATTTATSTATTATSTATTATSTATSSTSTSTGTTSAGTTSTTLVCSTASNILTTSCNSNSLSCSSVTVTTSVCASGLLCTTDSSGNAGCMYREDNLTTSGTIITIFLAFVVTSMISAIVFLCCRDRREQKRMKAKAEAVAIAKANAVNRPVPGGGYAAERTTSDGAGGANPFADTGAH